VEIFAKQKYYPALDKFKLCGSFHGLPLDNVTFTLEIDRFYEDKLQTQFYRLSKPTRGFAPEPHRLLKKAGKNFALGWALPLDPFVMNIFGVIYFFTGYKILKKLPHMRQLI